MIQPRRIVKEHNMIKKTFVGTSLLLLTITVPVMAQNSDYGYSNYNNYSDYNQPFLDSNGNPTGTVIGRHGLVSQKELHSDDWYIGLHGGVAFPMDSDID